jgi:hypothetical protein
MDYYDRYTPLEANDLENEVKFKGDSALKKSQALNRGYHKIIRNNVEIGVYGSGTHESPIRNAETGEYYKYKVGTFDEDLFYKVMICTGEFPSGPLTLFYNSPEHYERHQYTEVDNLHKKLWEEKKQRRQDFLDKQNKKSRS